MLRALTGVDPAPFRTQLLPYVRKLPASVSFGLLALATALSLPIDAFFGRRAVGRSWHAVFVLEARTRERHHDDRTSLDQ